MIQGVAGAVSGMTGGAGGLSGGPSETSSTSRSGGQVHVGAFNFSPAGSSAKLNSAIMAGIAVLALLVIAKNKGK